MLGGVAAPPAPRPPAGRCPGRGHRGRQLLSHVTGGFGGRVCQDVPNLLSEPTEWYRRAVLAGRGP